MIHKYRLQSLLLGSALVAALPLSAADVTWDIAPGTVGVGNGTVTGGVGMWNLANGNWTTDGGANNVAWNNANIDTAIFGGTSGFVTIDGADVAVGGLTVNTNNYDIRSNSAEKIVFAASGNLNVTIGTTFVRAAISETGGARKIVKIGAGTVELFGANDFSGGLQIDAGVARAMGGGNSFGGSGSTITINGGQIHGRNTQVHQQGLVMNQAKTSFVKGNAGSWEFTGAVTGSGGLQVNDAGTFTLDANGYFVSSSGSPTYASWSGGAAADEDANGDGVSNAVAWALDAADVNENAVGLLPTLDNSDPTFFIFNFNRSNDAEADANTAITLQYGSDLSGWTTAVDNGTTVRISTTPDTPTTAVRVEIDRSVATGNKLFVRLNVAVTP